jgi:hypothetical protein
MCVVFIFAAPVTAPQGCEGRSACRAACDEVKEKIGRIHARMRNGYGAREGESLQAELRRLRERRLRVCR